VLPLAIKGLIENCRNPIGRIFVVSPNEDFLSHLLEIDTRIELLSDVDILGFDFENMPIEVRKIRGWFSQQLIKLQSVYLSKEKYILWLDADTILNSPRVFATSSTILELLSDEYHLPYFRGLNTLFGFRIPRFRLSRISHHNIVCTTTMREFFEANSIVEPKDLFTRILDILDLKRETSDKDRHIFGNKSFSEYELNSLILESYRVPRARAYWWNESRGKLTFGSSFEELGLGKLELLSGPLRPNKPYSISFHTWNRPHN